MNPILYSKLHQIQPYIEEIGVKTGWKSEDIEKESLELFFPNGTTAVMSYIIPEEDDTFEKFMLETVSSVPLDGVDPMVIKSICTLHNRRTLGGFAVPWEGGILLRGQLPEIDVPVTKERLGLHLKAYYASLENLLNRIDQYMEA